MKEKKQTPQNTDVYLIYFLVQNDSTFHPVLDLRGLNRFLKLYTFLFVFLGCKMVLWAHCSDSGVVPAHRSASPDLRKVRHMYLFLSARSKDL